MSLMPAVSIASTNLTVPVTLFSQYARRLLHRFADALVCGEVHDLGDVASSAELDDEVEVGDVALDQLCLDDGVAVAVFHRVEDDDFVTEGA